ncbi:hypothetical protein BDB00DRAFT_791874 [Zychaea mexicana]|uniref:uncharacterized protein n=1 Tax=Zychaea mexicana TaxID=64656 RepID=UPI0022FDF1C6|nr:uncharacterized protein BDB00DRAFT_791874 [Zychaea mexicana]KAI9488443.1 hypothetical protein BDB00DRAFT_791874 [Zychaea mexicana]
MSLPLARQLAASTRQKVLLPRHCSSCCSPRLSSLTTTTLQRHYASAATATIAEEKNGSSVLSQQQQLQPVILPNPALQAFRHNARVMPSTIAEQFAILNACIRSGDMVRAERIMKELHRTKTDEMKTFADLHIYNTFLNGFAESPLGMAHECLNWLDNMKAYGLSPDANSYAIVAKAYLRNEGFMRARAVLQEMQEESSITVQDAIKSEFLTEHDVNLFRKIITESSSHQSGDVQKLLKELDEATQGALEGSSIPMENVRLAETSAATPLDSEPIVDNVPEARPTKAVGVAFLREQLQDLQDPQKVAKMDPYELQLGLEQQGYDVAMQRLIHMKESSRERGDTLAAMNLTPLKNIMWEWHQKTMPLIVKEIERCEEASTGRGQERKTYGPFLKLLKPETLTMITMLELLRLHNSSGIADGMKTARAVIDIGKAVEMEYNALQIKKSSAKRAAKNHEVHNLFASGKLFNMAVRRAHMDLMKQQDAVGELVESSEGDTGSFSGGEWTPVWPSTIRAKVGSVLASIFIDAAKIPVPSFDPETGEKIIEQIPAFFHTYQYVKGKRVGIIKFSDPLTKLLSKEPVRDTLHPRLLPMIVHPRPWLSYNSGGYLSAKSSCMRIKDSPEQLVYLHKASEQDRLNAVLAGLDVLGSTQWRVNKNVFNVVLESWNAGEPIADIPPTIEEFAPLPPKPENYDTDPKAKFNWVNAVKAQQTEEKNKHSLRCDVNYKVETARAFLNLPMFFPHNMDFRGRAYPIPPTLNHLGNDLCRGILMFGEAKPLGERGWGWLKIHLANLYGYDKHSFTEREQFTVDNMPNILDSVDNPLTGTRWWLQAESPWQCLAACFEVAAAHRSGSPTEFMSQIPIHQDGTCNGLQHYAALGGDMAGAQAVNLAPSDRPADVYTGVAEMVNKLIEKEAAEGEEYAQHLVGKISRKVVKQTVMTNVYGVTFIGARQQIISRLRERDDIPQELIYQLSGYLAKKVFASLGEMFNGARKIQDWLTDSARRIAKSIPEEALHEAGILEKPASVIAAEVEQQQQEAAAAAAPKKRRGRVAQKKVFSARNPSANQMTSVIWTTPLGLPIVQPYRRAGKKQVATLLQTVFIEDPEASRPVNALKQSTAFPPNFIHSLDATHMLMSAVACHEKGMTFASVHDSYWTHACDVDDMNKVIRDQFIELHSQPIMENLFQEFQERYKHYKVPVVKDLSTGKRKSKKPKAAAAAAAAAEEEEEAEAIVSGEKSHDKLEAFGFADPTVVDEELTKAEDEKNAMDALFGLDDGGNNDDEGADVLLDDALAEEMPKTAKKKSAARRYDYTWEDLELLPLPEKGKFDINQVKESDYFFH